MHVAEVRVERLADQNGDRTVNSCCLRSQREHSQAKQSDARTNVTTYARTLYSLQYSGWTQAEDLLHWQQTCVPGKLGLAVGRSVSRRQLENGKKWYESPPQNGKEDEEEDEEEDDLYAQYTHSPSEK